MNIQNPRYNAHGTIDVDIEHPDYGWIPYTASPDDIHSEVCRSRYAAALAGEYGEIAPYVEPVPTVEELRAEWKAQRAENVARITVTTAAGNTFDGDETSQTRMARAILGLQGMGEGATISWVLADNSVIQATAAELTEALQLAGQAQAALWIEEGV